MRRRFKRKKGVKISKAKKNVYNGIEFDSGLEVYAYKQLKASGLNFEYEPEGFILKLKDVRHFEVYKKTPKKPFHVIKTKGNLGIKYTTDFAIYNDKGDITHIIETKGYMNERFTVVVKLFYTYAINNLPALKNFFMPSNQKSVDEAIEIILATK